tara:strand:+ start:3195 stop:3704 length:510 start_codon:yes stop_codon:yes gene_type:complete
MKTVSELKKEIAVIDGKIAKYPAELIRKVRAVESMRLHLAELVESIDIGSDNFDSGDLDQTAFAVKNHKSFGRVRSRLEDRACYGVVVSHYRAKPEFVKASDELVKLANDRAKVADALSQAEREIENLRKEEQAELEAAKEQAVKEVESKGTPVIAGVRKRISELIGGS